MNITQAFDYIRKNKPSTVYLNGKTATGKSTFAQKLHQELGYQLVELDKVVQSAVIVPYKVENEGQAFVEVYKNRDRTDYISSFVAASRKQVTHYQSHGFSVVIDGAVANPATLAQLTDALPKGIVIYLHPEDLSTYRRNLAQRFMNARAANTAGLPLDFWRQIDPVDFRIFCEDRALTPNLKKAIATYAEQSQNESLNRLTKFETHFDNILKVEI